MDASDLIKLLQNTLRGGDRPHMENRPAARFSGALVRLSGSLGLGDNAEAWNFLLRGGFCISYGLS
jgi:hypothetical protein